jgi:hypothetical protein
VNGAPNGIRCTRARIDPAGLVHFMVDFPSDRYNRNGVAAKGNPADTSDSDHGTVIGRSTDMSDHLATSNTARRTFLGSIAGIAALLPITACLASATPSESTETSVEPTAGGYRVTPHIRSYYRSAAAIHP